ncbi:MAG: flavin monoamine oxidase family protein [Mobilitalea sp.]
MYASLNHVMNPTDEQRHELLRNSLENAGRPEDYDYITALLSPPPDITNFAAPGELRGVKIGIIGGGLAGMSAAFELRKLGADITILEASNDRIGGRVYTFYFDSKGKYYGELGAMRIPASHNTTWYYINLFGLSTIPVTSLTPNNFLYVHNTRLRTTASIEESLYPKYDLTPQERNTPWPKLHDYAFQYPFMKLPPNLRAELISILPSYSPELVPLMNMSLRENFESLGLSQGAINLISAVDPASGAFLNISYDEIAQEEYSLDYTNTYCIEGGNVNLPLAFYNSIQLANPQEYRNIPEVYLGNVAFKHGHYVTGIYQSGYRNKVVLKYTNTTDKTDAADVFDYVISAIPFSVLREVEIKPAFRNMKMQAILESNYIDAQKTLFLCNKRFWERNAEYGNILGGISYTDLPIRSIIYPYDHNDCTEDKSYSPDEPGVLTSSGNQAQNAIRVGGMEDDTRYKLIRQNVEEVHGLPRGFLNTIVERYQTVHWNSEPLYRGALAYNLPKQKRLFAYEMQQPEYSNHVFFAGEHTSAKHGWIQGALSSGKAAANCLAASFHHQY